jgi:hypothetical protein
VSSLLRKAGALIVAVAPAELPIWIYREPAKRKLVVHDGEIERVQGRRDQGAHRQARARLRIIELVEGWRGAGSANYRCSHWFLRSRGLVGPKLSAVAVTGGHLIPVIYIRRELADLTQLGAIGSLSTALQHRTARLNH